MSRLQRLAKALGVAVTELLAEPSPKGIPPGGRMNGQSQCHRGMARDVRTTSAIRRRSVRSQSLPSIEGNGFVAGP